MITYLSWWYFIQPINIFNAVLITTSKTFNTFSVKQLFLTFFAPWKRDVLYVENPSLQARFKIFISNMISRLIGAIARFFVIIIGIFCGTLVFLFGIIILIIWLCLPIIIFYFFFAGLKDLYD